MSGAVSRGTVVAHGQAWSTSLQRYVDLMVDASGNLSVSGSSGGGDATAANQVIANGYLLDMVPWADATATYTQVTADNTDLTANNTNQINVGLQSVTVTKTQTTEPNDRFAVAGQSADLHQHAIPLGTSGRSVIVEGTASGVEIPTNDALAHTPLVSDADVAPLRRVAMAGQAASLLQYPMPLGLVGRSILVEGYAGGDPINVTALGVNLHLLSGTTSASGNTLLVTPADGSHTTRVHYCSYNPAAAVTAGFRFGTTGTLFITNTLTQGGSVIAKDFGDFRYVESGGGESLYLNLSAAVSTTWNILYSIGTT